MMSSDDETDPLSSGSDSRSARRTRTWRSLNRLEAFSDGVFAIVTTILIFNLKVPDSPDGLLNQLRDQWPSFLGYIIAFAFIGGLWIAHTNLTRLLDTVDPIFLALNLLQLFFVSTLPFSTSLFTAHMLDSGRRVAAVAFALNLGLSALVGAILVSYVARRPELVRASDRAELALLRRQRWIGVVLLAVSFLVSVLLPQGAIVADFVAVLLLLVQPLWGFRRFDAGATRARSAADRPR
jgi:uncharacterized membrane protein